MKENQEALQKKTKIVEKIVEVEKIIEVPVEKIIIKEVIKEVPVEKIVERIIEIEKPTPPQETSMYAPPSDPKPKNKKRGFNSPWGSPGGNR